MSDKKKERLSRRDKAFFFWLGLGLIALYLTELLTISHYFPLGAMRIVSNMISFTIGLAGVILLAILFTYPSYWKDVDKVLRLILRKPSKPKGGDE